MNKPNNRRDLLKAGLFTLGAAAVGAAAARTVVAEEKDECDALFVLSARRITFDGKAMTLHTPDPNVVWFCDRPVRQAGHMTLPALSEQVQKGENNFKENPPNAAVSIFNDDGSVEEVVVTLPTAPVIGKETAVFEVIGLDGKLPAEGGAVTVFIDPIGHPLSPGSVAGIHRRHRRRARRRCAAGVTC